MKDIVMKMLKPAVAAAFAVTSLMAAAAPMEQWEGQWSTPASKDRISITKNALTEETIVGGKPFRTVYKFVAGRKAPDRNGSFFMESSAPQDKGALLKNLRENLAFQKANRLLDASTAKEKKMVEAMILALPEGKLETLEAFVNDDQGSGDCAGTSFVLANGFLYHLQECESDGSGLHITRFARK